MNVLHSGKASRRYHTAVNSGHNFTGAPGNCRPANGHRYGFNDTRRPTQTASCGDRCVFPTFPVASVEVRRVLPPVQDSPHPAALMEERCDWRSPGIPPVSIGAETRRGHEEEWLKLSYLPPPPHNLPPSLFTHTHTHTIMEIT